jgi:hypothetical protein
MTARELIRELRKLPPDTELFRRSRHFNPDAAFPIQGVTSLLVEPYYGVRRVCRPRAKLTRTRERVVAVD